MIGSVFIDSAGLGAGMRVDLLKLQAEPRQEHKQGHDVDQEIVVRARAGDIDAFKDLVVKYQNRAFSIAFGVVGNREDAEDIVQEAFLKAHRNLASFRGQSSFYTWLYRIVFNLAIDLSRKRYRRAEAMIGDNAALDAVTQSSAADGRDFVSRMPKPDEVFDRSVLGKKLTEAIDGLSPQHRAVIILREIEGLSYSEISDVVGCTKGTVMSRLHHARKRLQSVLAEFMPSFGKHTATDTIDEVELEQELNNHSAGSTE